MLFMFEIDRSTACKVGSGCGMTPSKACEEGIWG